MVLGVLEVSGEYKLLRIAKFFSLTSSSGLMWKIMFDAVDATDGWSLHPKLGNYIGTTQHHTLLSGSKENNNKNVWP